MSQTGDVLARIVALLDAAGIPHMLAGSLASSVHGRPRTTQDVDLVIEADEERIAKFVASLSPDEWYADAGVARDAVRRRSMFNVIDLVTGWKVDLVTRKARAFSAEEFARRKSHVVLGVNVPVASAEDTIITKLEWSKLSNGSERQRRDVQGILELKGNELDFEYIERWIRDLALEEEWSCVHRAEGGQTK